MVNSEMFKGAFNQARPQAAPARPGPTPVPFAPAAPQPQPRPQYEDPEVAKLKFFFLKWLSILIGGAAILLIVWRVVLKFT